MNRSSKLGILLLCVFALPFTLGGLAAIKQAITLAQSPSGNLPYWMVGFFGLVFTSVGIGIMFAAFYGAKLLQRKQKLQAEHPSEPWLWRQDWAQGRVKSDTRNTAIAGWIFAIFWNAVSMPVAFLALPKLLSQKPSPAYLIFLFPIVGVFLLFRAVRQTIALFEFGKTYFEMSSVPGVIGRPLKGQIQARFPHSPDHGIHLMLSCIHRVTSGSGNTRTTQETIVWRDESDLNSTQIYPGPTGTTIPVAFRIPLDAQPTLKRSVSDEFVWKLEALADVPGVNYHDVFEVPVFRTQQTPTQEEAATFAPSQSAPSTTRPAVSTIQVTQTAAGTEFYFPAARNKGFALSLMAFMTIFAAVAAITFHRALIIFPLAFGFFAFLLFYFALQLLLRSTRVVIGNNLLTVQAGWLGGGNVRPVQFSEIATIAARITAQQGGSSGTPLYDIELTLNSRQTIPLGHTLPNKREVDWLVSEMRRLTVDQPRSMTAGTI